MIYFLKTLTRPEIQHEVFEATGEHLADFSVCLFRVMAVFIAGIGLISTYAANGEPLTVLVLAAGWVVYSLIQTDCFLATPVQEQERQQIEGGQR